MDRTIVTISELEYVNEKVVLVHNLILVSLSHTVDLL